MSLSALSPMGALVSRRRPPAIPRGWSAGTAFAALCLVNVVLALLLLGRQPPGASQGQAAAPPALPPQVNVLLTQIAEGRHGEPYVLSLTERELTDTAAYFVANSQDVPFRQVTVRIDGDRLVADAVYKAPPVPVRLQATLRARDGALMAQVVDVSLGNMPLPGPVREQVLREASKALDFARYDMPLSVDSVELRQGTLAMSGTVK